jgi:hypothetical protein
MPSFSNMFPDVDLALVEAIVGAIWQRNGRRLPGGEIRFRCPQPEDHRNGDEHASARWNPAKMVWRCDACGAGGGALDLARRLGITIPTETIYAIRTIDGTVVALHVRIDHPDGSKECYWRRPTGESGLDGMPLETLPFYGSERLATATSGARVVVTEGEKCVDHLVRHGVLAVGTATGAGKTPADPVLGVLRGLEVVLWPDADAQGRAHMGGIAGRLRALSIPVRLVDPWPDASDGRDCADFTGTDTELAVLLDSVTKPEDARPTGPWARAVTAAAFVAQQDDVLDWLEPRLLASGSITQWFSPRGLGKTQAALALAIKLARREHRVLLLDRDNSKRELRRRLRGWGAADVTRLAVMTRDDVPPFTDRAAWQTFPFSTYELVIVDSLDASTEGVGEQDSAKSSKALAPILDIAHRADGPAILILGNTIKSGTHGRASGIYEDRADVVYEVRDATDFTPTGQKPWWVELPTGGREAWADRASRRHRRTSYVLAFVPSKFRIGEEPDPFALEVDHADVPWTLREVTAEIVAAGEAASQTEADRRVQRQQVAVDRLVAEVGHRADVHAEPLTRTAAVDLLRADDSGVSREAARTLLNREAGTRWRLVKDEARHGRPVLVLGLHQVWPAKHPAEAPESEKNPEPPQKDENLVTRVSQGVADPHLVAGHAAQGPQEDSPRETQAVQGVPPSSLLAAAPPDASPPGPKPRRRVRL